MIPPKIKILAFLLFFSFSCIQVSEAQTDSIHIEQQNIPLTEDISTGLTYSQDQSPGFIGTIMRGLLGMVVLIGISYLFSINRKAVSHKFVALGLLFQIILAICLLYVPLFSSIISFIGKLFTKVLDSSAVGAEFLFGDLMDTSKYGSIFVFQILPTIVFFSALMSLFFYLGIIQRIVFAMAWLLKKALRMSGAESLAVAGNVFLGQTESPLLIKAYLPKLTGSEIFLVMTSGMATIAGGVLALYIGMLGGDDPLARELFARHLITASVLAAPGAVVVSKILFPQTENIEKEIHVPRDQMGENILDSIGTGASEGLKLAVNVAVMLLVFYSLIALTNILFGQLGKIPVSELNSDNPLSINELIALKTDGLYAKLSIEYLLGQIFSPLMWIIGVPKEDLSQIGRLLGEKIIFTELVSYSNLKDLLVINAIKNQKSIIMATYMLCGFANIASVGIQIGGIGALAPNKRVFISKYGIKALIGGTIASLLSATIIGVIA